MSGIKRMILGIAIMLLGTPFAVLGASDSTFFGIALVISVLGLACVVSGFFKSDKE
ncbi:MAG: hypothetical protein K6G72_13285 [Lachnospiraceae bacterium]|nr:hypothetical protein [Lachnospiraceae bacterium]